MILSWYHLLRNVREDDARVVVPPCTSSCMMQEEDHSNGRHSNQQHRGVLLSARRVPPWDQTESFFVLRGLHAAAPNKKYSRRIFSWEHSFSLQMQAAFWEKLSDWFLFCWIHSRKTNDGLAHCMLVAWDDIQGLHLVRSRYFSRGLRGSYYCIWRRIWWSSFKLWKGINTKSVLFNLVEATITAYLSFSGQNDSSPSPIWETTKKQQPSSVAQEKVWRRTGFIFFPWPQWRSIFDWDVLFMKVTVVVVGKEVEICHNVSIQSGGRGYR